MSHKTRGSAMQCTVYSYGLRTDYDISLLFQYDADAIDACE